MQNHHLEAIPQSGQVRNALLAVVFSGSTALAGVTGAEAAANNFEVSVDCTPENPDSNTLIVESQNPDVAVDVGVFGQPGDKLIEDFPLTAGETRRVNVPSNYTGAAVKSFSPAETDTVSLEHCNKDQADTTTTSSSTTTSSTTTSTIVPPETTTTTALPPETTTTTLRVTSPTSSLPPIRITLPTPQQQPPVAEAERPEPKVKQAPAATATRSQATGLTG